MVDTFKGHCILCLAFEGKGYNTNSERLPTSYLHATFEQNQSIYGRDTFKGHCGIYLAFGGKGHETNSEQLPISYLPAKFEQNRSINS